MPFLSRIGSSSAKAVGFSSSLDVFDVVVSSNSTQLDLRTHALANGWDGTKRVLLTINSGIYLYSTSTSTPALTISGSFPQGVFIVNNGIIVGKGGNGGRAGDSAYYSSDTPDNSSPGLPGGNALSISTAVNITNNGTIAGGGGGGGGGMSINTVSEYYNAWSGGAGGGGGGGGRGGLSNSTGAVGGLSYGTAPGYFPDTDGSSGSAGTYLSAGAGGASGSAGVPPLLFGGNGGSGGNWGAAGSAGATVSGTNVGSAGAGGAAGKYATGNSYITWLVSGTRLGGVA